VLTTIITYINPTMPMTQALNMLDRYHLLGSVVCFSWLSARSESLDLTIEADMFETKKRKEIMR
jgi:hypothetical protein